MSPSRKIENINLVLLPKPMIAFSKEFKSIYLSDGNDIYGSDNVFTRKLKNFKKQNLKQHDVTGRSAEKENVFQVPEVPTTFVESADMRFNRATSTPKSSSVSTMIKNIEMKRVLYDLSRKNSSTSEHDSMNRAMNLLNIPKNIPKSRKLSPLILEKVSIFESNSSVNSFDQSYTKTSSDRLLLERNIRSIDSVRAKASIFESNSSMDSSDQNYTKPSSNHIQSIDSAQEDSSSTNNFDQSCAGTLSEISNISSDDSIQSNLMIPIDNTSPIRKLLQELERGLPLPRKEAAKSEIKRRTPRLDAVNGSINSVEGKILNVDKKLPNIHSLSRKKSNSNEQWPYKKFLGLEKSAESPASNSKQPDRKETVIQKIIRIFNEKVEISESRYGKKSDLSKNFVKQLVKALEREDISAMKKMTHGDEEDSCNKSKTKSYAMSMTSLHDTDASSDCNQESPTEKCDEQRYDTGNLTTAMENLTVEIEEKTEEEEDDSVYWIPIRMPKLPRSSSLLSVISKLSSNGYSPCISPIRGEDETEFSQQATSKQDAAKRLFKIDETVVIDSGYSDRSERSVLNSVPSVADNIWYDDAFLNFQPERKSHRRKWSLKPVSIAGHTYHAQ